MYIYQNIKSILERNKLQQKDFASAMNVSENTVMNWLKHSKGIRAEQLPVIAKVLHVPVTTLVSDNYKPTNQPHTVKEEKGAYTLPASDDYKEELVSMQKEMIAHLKSQLEYFKNKYETELALNMELKQAK